MIIIVLYKGHFRTEITVDLLKGWLVKSLRRLLFFRSLLFSHSSIYRSIHPTFSSTLRSNDPCFFVPTFARINGTLFSFFLFFSRVFTFLFLSFSLPFFFARARVFLSLSFILSSSNILQLQREICCRRETGETPTVREFGWFLARVLMAVRCKWTMDFSAHGFLCVGLCVCLRACIRIFVFEEIREGEMEN